MKEEEGGIRKNAHPTFFNSNSCDRCSPLAGTTNAFSSIFVLFGFDSICEKRSGWENNFFNSKKKKRKRRTRIFYQYILKRVAQTGIENFYSARSGTEGFEPPNTGTKTRCLTTWPRPIFDFYSTLIKTNIDSSSSSILVQIYIE